MFNTTSQNQLLKINAASGTIFKNYKESFFVRFQLTSVLAMHLLCDSPEYRHKPVVVIQMMSYNEEDVIAELIYKKDYDLYFNHNEEVE